MSPRLLIDKTCAITGGVTGIGRAIALAYLSHGARVAVNHLGDPSSIAHFEALAKEATDRGLLVEAASGAGGQEEEKPVVEPETGAASGMVGGGVSVHEGGASEKRISNSVGERLIEVRGDVGDPSTGKKIVDEVVRTWGRLDVFVSNAGICEFRDFLEITPSLWSQTLNTNLTGAFHSVQAAALQMSHQTPPGGSIIGISSISALVGGSQQAHYTPTKAGVLSLIQSAACALGKYGIRCNALLPGTIRTQLNEEDLKDDVKRKYMEGRIPLGRTGEPKDLGGPAVFLASEELSGYMTGAQLLIDGGLFVNLQ